MITNLTKEDLIAFEEEIEEIYKTGVIRGPIHLRGGNEEQLLEIFKYIKEEDIVLATWANHLEALLKNIPKDKIKERILAGHSMAMNFPEYNFYTSAIVNGVAPIAVGMAWAVKEKKEKRKINCFLGDMAFLSGASTECIQYSINFNLPIAWIIADNNLSVGTITSVAWNYNMIRKKVRQFRDEIIFEDKNNVSIKYYSYKNAYSHSGVGAFVSF